MPAKTLKIYHCNNNHYGLMQMISLGGTDEVKVVSRNLLNEPLTPTQLIRLKERLKVTYSELLQSELEPKVLSQFKEAEEEENIMRLLAKKPNLMQTPIVDDGHTALIIKQPTDILKLKSIDLCIDGHDHLKTMNK